MDPRIATVFPRSVRSAVREVVSHSHISPGPLPSLPPEQPSPAPELPQVTRKDARGCGPCGVTGTRSSSRPPVDGLLLALALLWMRRRGSPAT